MQEGYLLEAVESVAAQTYRSFEVIVVDDCSPDVPAAEILADFDLPSLQVIRHDENLGPSAARNTAVRKSCGELILPLDADDKIAPNYLEEARAAFAEDVDLGAVFTSVQFFGADQHIWHPGCSLAGLLCDGSPNTFLYKRAMFDSTGGYNASLRLGENTDFWLRAQLSGWRFRHLSNPLYLYRKHRDAQTLRHDFVPERARALVREHKQLFVDHLDEVLLELARRQTEQLDTYKAVYEQYSQLNDDVSRQYEELNIHYEHLSAHAEREQTGFLGRLASMFGLKVSAGGGT